MAHRHLWLRAIHSWSDPSPFPRIPAGLFQKLLDGAVVDESHAQAAKYPLVKIGSVDTLTVPNALHDRLVALLDGVTGASARNG